MIKSVLLLSLLVAGCAHPQPRLGWRFEMIECLTKNGGVRFVVMSTGTTACYFEPWQGE